jgi:transcriptional regulator with XRE-family HTH domain
MPTAPDNHDAHDYAERIRERLPRRLQELRERCGLSMYALWMMCGVSRDMISRIEGGESIPTLHIAARMARGVEKTLTEFVEPMDDE